MKLPILLTGALLFSATASAADMSLSKDDQKFLEDAHQGGVAEIRFSELALKVTTSDEVKKLARQMITDHTAANEELKKLGVTKKFVPSAELSKATLKTEEKLRGLSGSKFDDAYLAAMKSDHKDAITLFGDAADDADDGDIKKFAAKTLPTLHHHMGMIEVCEKQMANAKKS